MNVWLDAQLSERLAAPLAAALGCRVLSLRQMGLHASDDGSIFAAARNAQACVVTRDEDFASLVLARGAPPAVVLLAGPNLPHLTMLAALKLHLPDALDLVVSGEPLVEIKLWPFARRT
jgi:predicted nuclease of predicted toxin-antitoxin system